MVSLIIVIMHRNLEVLRIAYVLKKYGVPKKISKKIIIFTVPVKTRLQELKKIKKKLQKIYLTYTIYW